MKKIIYILVIAVMLTACTKVTDEPKQTAFAKEYEALNGQDNGSGREHMALELENTEVIKYANYEEIEAVLDGTGLIYFGFPECPWCRTLVPALLESAKETGLEEIYYMNILNERDSYSLKDGELITDSSGTKGYGQLIERLWDHLEDYELTDKEGNKVPTGTRRLYAPTLVFVLNGEIEYVHVGTIDSQTDPYVALSKEQKEELMTIFIGEINSMLNITCEEETSC